MISPWSSRWVRWNVSHRLFILLMLVVLMVVSVWLAQRVPLSAKMTDYYPSQHPHVRLYREFAEMLKLANAVVVTVTVKEGSIYTNEALGKVHRLTVDLIETRGVNPHEVMSLTHPRLKDIRVSSENIEILPVVNSPEQPQAPDVLARIKNAVYTNLGIRGVYVSADDKTALIRAGFWDGMVEPQEVFTRLQDITDRERDVNTDVHFTGTLVLAAWLQASASRILLLLATSGVLALFLCGQSLGSVQLILFLLLVNVVAASVSLGFLGVRGLTLDPLMLFVFFPLGVRGMTLVISWYTHLLAAYRTFDTPFAPQESQTQVLEQTAMQVYRPLTIALGVDGLALFSLILSDVPVIQSLAVLGAGWNVGLLLALWLLFPLWSATFRLRQISAFRPSRMERLIVRLTYGLQNVIPSSSLRALGLLALAGLGVVAAVQLRAGKEMMGATLFYASHPYNQAFSLVNEKFIGVHQLIVVAQANDEMAFRNPQALRTIEAFQQHMADDRDFGGTVAITNLIKSVTRMFHEDIPKWEVIPDDLDSAGQVIFRVISSAATPSEVSRLFSQDFRATAVSFFYRQYSPSMVTRILERAHGFRQTQGGVNVQLHIGGGLLGILSAVHSAVEQSYWQFFVVLLVFSACGAFLARSVRAVLEILGVVIFTQTALLLLLWWGGIDLNMYSFPVIVASLGMFLPVLFTQGIPPHEDSAVSHTLMIASVITAVAAMVWLLSPLRLQAEMGVFMIVAAFLNVVLVFQFQRVLGSLGLTSYPLFETSTDRLQMPD